MCAPAGNGGVRLRNRRLGNPTAIEKEWRIPGGFESRRTELQFGIHRRGNRNCLGAGGSSGGTRPSESLCSIMVQRRTFLLAIDHSARRYLLDAQASPIHRRRAPIAFE